MPKIMLNGDKVQQLVVNQLESWVASLPEADQNAPFVTSAGPNSSLSPLQILNEVRDGTPLGVQLMESAYSLNVISGFRSNRSKAGE